MEGQQGGATPQFSPDGKWWWDGTKWIAVEPAPAAEAASAPAVTAVAPVKAVMPHQTRSFWIGVGVVVLAFTGMGVCTVRIPVKASTESG